MTATFLPYWGTSIFLLPLPSSLGYRYLPPLAFLCFCSATWSQSIRGCVLWSKKGVNTREKGVETRKGGQKAFVFAPLFSFLIRECARSHYPIKKKKRGGKKQKKYDHCSSNHQIWRSPFFKDMLRKMVMSGVHVIWSFECPFWPPSSKETQIDMPPLFTYTSKSTPTQKRPKLYPPLPLFPPPFFYVHILL